jgi:nucleoid-associated protein YgaU
MFARVAVIVALLALAVAYSARSSISAGHEQTYVVRVGDTLWTIAASHYGGDPREAVWRLQDRNHLAGTLVTPGERLVLP